MSSWKQKAMLQRAFSALPAGQRLNFLFQRHVTHGMPMPNEELRAAAEIGVHHVQRLAELSGRKVSEASFFEFGAGWDLHMPLVLWSMGVEHQLVVDLRPLVRPGLVADIARRLAGPVRLPEFVRLLPEPDTKQTGSFLHDLGIEYRAPCDARSTGLADGSVDFITSTNTLEHIPPEQILVILRECHRILARDGLMSFQIDYQDHYSYFDNSISAYNFLTFDEHAWPRYSPRLHFQNRLRHVDHLALLDRAGFALIEDSPAEGTGEDLDQLRTLTLAPPFDDADPEDLAVRFSRIVLAKRPDVE